LYDYDGGPVLQLNNLQANLNQVILGKETQIELIVGTLLAQGHVLLEDIPGTGKTTLAKALCKSIDGDFNRIQFTPDLLPSDILGCSIYQPQNGTFRLEKGPLFCNMFLADEINRAAPRTQSALLEAMAEGQITLEGQTLALEPPFMVIATQNTMENQGVFPLPEAQLDRFLLQMSLGYPTLEEELKILQERNISDPLDRMQPVISQLELKVAIEEVQAITVHPDILKYLLTLIHNTRKHPQIRLGASPRASIGLMKFGQALAYLRSKDHVSIDEIQNAFIPILSHRVFLNPSEQSKTTTQSVLEEVLRSTQVPR
tara:strand:- start:418 stop:1362 length:945 start_codon:yes stop_codon:yes gene_type:complete